MTTGTTGTTPLLKFNFNSKCQQKRGGDWFQVLSCITARSRTFTQILPDNGRQEIKLSETCPIYFVTHDQIAVAYALLNGVNVIYIDYYGRIFVFKNNKDKNVKGSGKPIEQILFEGMQQKYKPSSTIARGPISHLDELITSSVAYNSFRAVYLDEALKKYTESLEESRKRISPLSESSLDNSFMDIITSTMQTIFAEAVRLMFIKMNLIDISNNIAFVNSNKKILFNQDGTEKGYIAGNNSIINALSKSINKLTGIQNIFGKNSSTEPDNTLGNLHGIRGFIENNVKKLDVYLKLKTELT